MTYILTKDSDKMDTQELQKTQEEYDEGYWEKRDNDFENIRHMTLHMGKLQGKLSSYCERREHDINQPEQIINEVIPDLLFYSLKLSNVFKIDLEKNYLERLETNKQKWVVK